MNWDLFLGVQAGGGIFAFMVYLGVLVETREPWWACPASLSLLYTAFLVGLIS